MSSKDFLPHRESLLVQWSRNFRDRLDASGSSFGIDAAQVAAYAARHAAFIAAHEQASDPDTSTRPIIAAKNEARDRLTALARELARIIRANPAVTNEQRIALGLSVRDAEPSPSPRPSSPPRLHIMNATHGRSIALRLRDKDQPTRRGRPPGTIGATVFYFVGDAAPAELSAWSFAGNTTRPRIDIQLPPELPGGTRVWLTAFWFGTTAQPGPLAEPISTRLGDGVAKAA